MQKVFSASIRSRRFSLYSDTGIFWYQFDHKIVAATENEQELIIMGSIQITSYYTAATDKGNEAKATSYRRPYLYRLEIIGLIGARAEIKEISVNTVT